MLGRQAGPGPRGVTCSPNGLGRRGQRLSGRRESTGTQHTVTRRGAHGNAGEPFTGQAYGVGARGGAGKGLLERGLQIPGR